MTDAWTDEQMVAQMALQKVARRDVLKAVMWADNLVEKMVSWWVETLVATTVNEKAML